jgi:exosortase family protein XrtF
LNLFLIQYKPFLRFLGVFFAVYMTLTFVYQLFLTRSNDNQIDAITTFVSQNTQSVLKIIDPKTAIIAVKNAPYFELFYKQKKIARITEGCNAVSVIILFVAFVMAFSGKFRPTILFILGGSLFIFVLNVLRIVFLCELLYHFPDQEQLLHGVVFPLIIYGTVLGLWIVWVKKFSRYAL